MQKDLTTSPIHRNNILNNSVALKAIEQNTGIKTISYEGDRWLTKKQVQEFYEISDSTIERYLEKHAEELNQNGYKVLRGSALKTYKNVDATFIDEGSKIVVLGIFNFRAFLNLGMLLTESEKAKTLRSMILDIVIDVMNQKTGGHTKYINQRDEDFVVKIIKEESYREKFTAALNKYVGLGNLKYALYTNKVYKAIFEENRIEYQKILKLDSKENIRHTMYSEVLGLIASFENGIADELEKAYNAKGALLDTAETDEVFDKAAKNPFLIPLIEDARTKMASRDLCFRDALHKKLESYITSVPEADFERFLGEKSMDLEKRLEENKDVFKRLKDR
jgi:hypothetical protein